MEQINPDVLNQGIATMRSIANAFKAAKDIEGALALYAQTQGSIGDLTVRRDGLSNEVINLTAKRDNVRLELDQAVVALAEYRKTERAKIDEELRKARASAQDQVLIAQGAAQREQMVHAEDIKQMDDELAAKKAEVQAEQEKLSSLKAELAAIAAKIGG